MMVLHGDLGRASWRFGAPVSEAAGGRLSFVDGRLVGSAGGLFAAGMATSFPGQPMSQQSEQPHRW
jgi:hypothetical protein